MKIIYIVIILCSLILTDCAAHSVKNDRGAAIVTTILNLSDLVEEYREELNRWPISMDELKIYSSGNDSLKMLYESLSDEFKIAFSSNSIDSLQIHFSSRYRNSPPLTFWLKSRSAKNIISNDTKDKPSKVDNDSLQTEYDPYKRDLLSSILINNENKINTNLEVNAFIVPNAFKVYVIYGDSSREIPNNTSRVIREWAVNVMRIPNYNDSLFVKEYLFYEKGVPYWLPVQKGLMKILSTEVKKGLRIDLYITLVGATSSDLVFTVNEMGLPFTPKQ